MSLYNVLTLSCLLRNEQMRFLSTVAALSSQRVRNWIIYMMPSDRILPGPVTAAHACESESGARISLSHLHHEHATLQRQCSGTRAKGKKASQVFNKREDSRAMLLSTAADV